MAAVIILIAASATAWLRLPGLTPLTMWAEDGTVFLQRALAGMPLLMPYEGYLHLVPQAIATMTSALVPIDLAAPAMNALACLTAGAVASLVYVLARDAVPSRWPRAGIAFITVLAPLAPIEVLGNAANLHWLFLWLAPWLVLYRPRGWTESFLLGGVGLVAALSEIQMLIFLPLFLIPGGRYVIPLRAGVALGVVAQIVTALSAPRSEPEFAGSPGPLTIAGHYLSKVILPAFSVHGLRFLSTPVGIVVSILVLATLALCLAVVLRWGTRDRRILGLTLAIGSPAIWWLDSTVNRLPLDTLLAAPAVFLRHAVVPSMFLLALVGLAAQVLLESRRASLRGAAVAGSLTLALLLLVQFVPPYSTRQNGPSWPAAVQEAREACLSGDNDRWIPIAPVHPEGRWTVSLDCSRLSG